MKCPTCQFTSADTKDICPKCHLDLRPYKSAAGLPVVDAQTSYENMLRAMGVPVPEKKRGSLFGMFSRKKQDTPAIVEPISAAPSDSTPPTPEAVPPPTSEPKQPEPPRPSPRSTAGPVIKREIPLPPKKQQTTPPPSESPPPVPKSAPPAEELARIAPRAKPAADLRASVFQKFEPVGTAEIEPLFDEAQVELGALEEQSEVELTQEYLRSDKRDERVEALFNLAYEVVEHPDREQMLVERFTTSDQRQVEAQKLAGELAKVEKKMSAPVFGLRSIKERVASARKAESEEPVQELKPATIGQRLASFAIDTAVILALAVSSVTAVTAVVDRAFFRQLQDFLQSSETLQLSALTFCAAAFILFLAIYPLLSLLTSNRTLGQLLCHIRVTTELGRKPKLSHICVRSLLFPLSLLCFGYLPLLAGKRSFHDSLARTNVSQS